MYVYALFSVQADGLPGLGQAALGSRARGRLWNVAAGWTTSGRVYSQRSNGMTFTHLLVKFISTKNYLQNSDWASQTINIRKTEMVV